MHMSELKCCKLCQSFETCQTKTECCIECQYFDPHEMVCLAPDELKKSIKSSKPIPIVTTNDDDEVDPDTFLFDDDDDDDTDSVDDDKWD